MKGYTVSEGELLSINEIARRSGRSASAIHYILNGDREVSKKMATDLMWATGVVAAAWIWPEDMFNPYIPFQTALLDGRLYRDVTIRAGMYVHATDLAWKKIQEHWEMEGFENHIKNPGSRGEC